jgi:F-type H+-transporting ATPase subunit a
MLIISNMAVAGENPEKPGGKHEGFDAKEVILGHVKDAHDWHLFTWNGHEVSLPLPVMLYNKEKGFSFFSSSHFHHGEHAHEGYRILTKDYIVAKGLDPKKFKTGQMVMVDEADNIRPDAKFFDFSITKTVLQLFITAGLLLFLMIGVANKYKKRGINKAPTGFQNAVEPFITFVRDEVAKPMIGPGYEKFMPLLLTFFFFIWIANLLGLIPLGINITGNPAIPVTLTLVAFAVMMYNTNKHFWAHIFNPPVPGGVKPIMILVEVMGVFTKPFSLMIRLFANMIAGHLIILSIVSLIFIFKVQFGTGGGWGFSPVSFAFSVFMYFLELLVALIQAFIFTNLTALFIGQAREGAHHEAEHH